MLKILLISIPFLFIIGSLLHFAYEFCKKNKVVGLFAPINESIFEHSKLLLTPLILFWSFLFVFVYKNVDIDDYFFAMLISIVVSIITMVSFYYTYKGIFGNNYLLVDILDLLISLVVGQVVANHVYVYSNSFSFIISILIIVAIQIIYIYFTFFPLKIPFFIDKGK